MPSKGKRVAARQNDLRRRRGGANRATAVRNPAAASPVAASVAEAENDRPPTTAAAPAPATAAIGRPASASRGRRFDRPAAYNYVGSELTRIGIFSGVLVVVLVAVSFVL